MIDTLEKRTVVFQGGEADSKTHSVAHGINEVVFDRIHVDNGEGAKYSKLRYVTTSKVDQDNNEIFELESPLDTE